MQIPQRWQPLAHLVGARVREFVREPEAIFWVYGFPIILAVGLGFAFRSKEPEAPPVDIVAGPLAEQTASRLGSDELGPEKMKKVEIHPEEECKLRLKKGKTALYLLVQPGEDKYAVKYVYDEANADGVLARYWIEGVLSRQSPGVPSAVKELVTEPGSRYIDFLLPGIIGMNLMGGGLFGVGFGLVDMRVRKLFKRMMATPMRHSDFLLSLLIGRLLFLLPEMASLFFIGWYFFGVPMEGSVFTLALVILLSSMAFSGIGLLLGSRTEKTETMSGLMNMLMLPMWLCSGVFFSPDRFPPESQPLIQALPLTQVNEALRGVMLYGEGLWDLRWRIAILLAYAVISFALAVRWFKWR
jgi:ABC-type multidrug transport system permease subunit